MNTKRFTAILMMLVCTSNMVLASVDTEVEYALTPLIKYSEGFANADLGELNGPLAEIGYDINKYGTFYAYAGFSNTLTCKVMLEKKTNSIKYIDKESKYCLNHPEYQSSIKVSSHDKGRITAQYPAILSKTKEVIVRKIEQIRNGKGITLISLSMSLNRQDDSPSMLEFKFLIRDLKLARRPVHWKCSTIYSPSEKKFGNYYCNQYVNRSGER